MGGVGDEPCVGKEDTELLSAMRGRGGRAKCCGKKHALLWRTQKSPLRHRVTLDRKASCAQWIIKKSQKQLGVEWAVGARRKAQECTLGRRRRRPVMIFFFGATQFVKFIWMIWE